MNILCTICARKGSKGIKKKNLLNFFGKSLLEHTLEQAKKVKLIDSITISTDFDIRKKNLKKYLWFKRNKVLSNDTSGKIPVIIDALNRTEKKFKKKFDVIIDLDVTSPLRKVIDINSALKLFFSKKYDNLFSVTLSRKNPYFNMVEKNKKTYQLSKHTLNKYNRRQSLPKVYDMNAAIYIWNRNILLNNKSLFNNKTGIYLMPKERSLDIDDILDYKVAKFLYEKK